MTPDNKYTSLDTLPKGIFLCKALWAHDWDLNPSPKNIDGYVARMAYRIMCLRCKRCHRERYDYIDTRGGLIGRYYTNPVGYPKTHKFSGDELRAELINRSLLVTKYMEDGNA